MAFAIQARGLAKQYRIGQYAASYDTLREQIVRLGRRAVGAGAPEEDVREIWALRGVDFDIEEGEAVGIIGRNGAGKTTLLRILSRITEPTDGYADVYGRVGSLLEVGTGFHPELTGRENVFLNGAVLGMRQKEITRKFDEIVDFSGVEKFIDTPVKRYSTGMQVRLAFSVAAHLQPDILIVDEVLAVGDVEFQRKCLGRMESIGGEGRTVLFVSHNIPAIARLCQRVILLDQGRVVTDGPSSDVIARYLGENAGVLFAREWDADEAPGDAHARLRAIRVVAPDGETATSVAMTDAVGIEMAFEVLRDDVPLIPMMSVFNANGVLVFNALDPDPRWQTPKRGRHVSCAWIPPNLLGEGEYSVHAFINTIRPGRFDRHVSLPEAVSFMVSGPAAVRATEGGQPEVWGGVLAAPMTWTHDGGVPAPVSARD